ncbi:sodium/hydrogen exchanger 9B1 isoform X1 [Onychomys torridus]|uniref:sodium/hydrogen exchanger 9B1 isoform X1 n=2 Tax=Onychomys torridus TaxID=38674 RepID=UPI00167F8504|nr:sodium/hydrogen exchanger 9B1 isoform X1 [Onychomys torridus]XP_036045391.1 sodium/hydrogen exchanger 9B1 isoform X1 [Onychomys torridus]
MYRTEVNNDDFQPSTTNQPPAVTQMTTVTQVSSDPAYSSTYEDTKERKQQANRSTNSYCPPQGTFNKIITDGVTLIILWVLLWALMGQEVLPGGNLFGLIVIFYSAFLGGKILEIIRIPVVPPLPPLLGMLLAGFTIRNVPIIYKFVHIPTTWSSALRNTALTIILIRAGLGLDPQALKHLKGVCLRLSFGPCLIEACSAAFFSHFLMKFPWQWGFLLGFVLGAVSPAVVVPSMLLLQENGYGVEKGIPTLLVAASSMDDVVAITGFNTFLSMVFSSGSVVSNILSSLRDVFIGVLVGIVMGIFIQHFPSGDQERLTQRRAFLVLSICISAVLGCQHLGLHGSGGLVTLVLSFMAAKKWAKEKVGIQTIVANMWNVFQPLLFGLVGTEVSVEALESKTIGMCIATLGFALSARIIATFTLMSFAEFRFKEKVFIALSWIPKATVQAVLGPLALEKARDMAPHLEAYSKDVMTVAFLAILITAPNGALLIGILGPKILDRSDVTGPIEMELSQFEH